ncbi:MAG: GNAT family N-acetyltransferase [Acidiferrobacteraceae bacterium]
MTEVRRAGPPDLDTIVAIERACFGETSGGFSRRQIRRLLANPQAYWRTIDGNAVACWLKTTNGRTTWARLYSLAVNPTVRGQGLATKLLEDGFQWMASEKLVRCFAEVATENQGALNLYHRHGFKERALLPNYYGPGRDGVSLVKKLPD